MYPTNLAYNSFKAGFEWFKDQISQSEPFDIFIG